MWPASWDEGPTVRKAVISYDENSLLFIASFKGIFVIRFEGDMASVWVTNLAEW